MRAAPRLGGFQVSVGWPVDVLSPVFRGRTCMRRRVLPGAGHPGLDTRSSQHRVSSSTFPAPTRETLVSYECKSYRFYLRHTTGAVLTVSVQKQRWKEPLPGPGQPVSKAQQDLTRVTCLWASPFPSERTSVSPPVRKWGWHYSLSD